MISVEEIQQRLIDSQLKSPAATGQFIDQWRQQAGGEASGEGFLQWLVRQEQLTEFQSDALAAGHAGPFMLGPYRVCEHVMVGRLGGLFRAVHVEFNQPVCVKVFPSSLAGDPGRLARVGREARIFAELSHDNVARSFHVGHVGDTYYLVLEDLHGETLASRLQRNGPMPYRKACRLVRDLARGLQHLHENQVLHLDLRPEHVWLAEGDVPKILEFGAARDALAFVDSPDDASPEDASSPDGASPGDADEPTEFAWPDVLPGHYEYMAPEQALDDAEADERSDIYSVGCVLYHCLTGRPPFAETRPLKQALLHALREPQYPTELVPDLPPQVEETLWAMLAKLPQSRFQHARDIVFALDQYSEHDAPAEEVHVLDVGSEYLDWCRSVRPVEVEHISADSVSVTPELTEFLDWLDVRHRRRRRKQGHG